MTLCDAYEILGIVPESHNLAAAYKRYIRLIKRHHPDKGGDTATAQRLILAGQCIRAYMNRERSMELVVPPTVAPVRLLSPHRPATPSSYFQRWCEFRLSSLNPGPFFTWLAYSDKGHYYEYVPASSDEGIFSCLDPVKLRISKESPQLQVFLTEAAYHSSGVPFIITDAYLMDAYLEGTAPSQ